MTARARLAIERYALVERSACLMSTVEIRRWLEQIGFTPLPQLPKPGLALWVDIPTQRGLWRVERATPGTYRVTTLR